MHPAHASVLRSGYTLYAGTVKLYTDQNYNTPFASYYTGVAGTPLHLAPT